MSKLKDFILKHIRIQMEESNTYSVKILDDTTICCDQVLDGTNKDQTIFCDECGKEIYSNGEIDSIINHIEEEHPEVLK